MNHRLSRNAYGKKKASIAAQSSLEGFLAPRISRSATESIEDEQVQTVAETTIKEYIVNSIVDILSDGKIFFNQDPSIAYEEFQQLLADESIKHDIVSILAQNRAKTYLDEWDEPTEDDIARDKALVQYIQADNRIQGLEAELQERKKYLSRYRDEVNSVYPNLLVVEIDDTEGE